MQNQSSLESNDLAFKLMTRHGVFSQPLSHPTRYYVYFAQKQESLETIQGIILNESKLISDSKDSKLVTWMNNFECPVAEITVRPDSKDPSIHRIEFVFEKDGTEF